MILVERLRQLVEAILARHGFLPRIRVDWAVVALTLICAIAATMYIVKDGLPILHRKR